mgnify:CR=1 FL=1
MSINDALMMDAERKAAYTSTEGHLRSALGWLKEWQQAMGSPEFCKQQTLVSLDLAIAMLNAVGESHD